MHEPLERIGAFEVPVFARRHQDGASDKALRAVVLESRDRVASVQSSNKSGGWHSPRDLHRWPQEAVGTFLARIEAMLAAVIHETMPAPEPRHLEGWLISAWANVNLKGASNESHEHFWNRRRALWSGVYYVDPGSSASGGEVTGRTIFEDRVLVPRPLGDARNPFGSEIAVTPQAGLMLMFPAALPHRVEPYAGDGERITLAFNLYHPGFAVPLYDDQTRLAHITLPRTWRPVGEALAKLIPQARYRIQYARPPLADDLAMPLEEALKGSLAGPLRRSS